VAEVAEGDGSAHVETVSFGKSNFVHGDEEKTVPFGEFAVQ